MGSPLYEFGENITKTTEWKGYSVERGKNCEPVGFLWRGDLNDLQGRANVQGDLKYWQDHLSKVEGQNPGEAAAVKELIQQMKAPGGSCSPAVS